MNVVNSVVRLNFHVIKRLEKASITALEKTVNALHTEVVKKQVIPFDTGNLQNTSTFEDYSNSKRGQVKLISSTPYARRMYFHPEYNFQTKENANARGMWYEPWISGDEKEFCEKAFAKFFKKEANL